MALAKEHAGYLFDVPVGCHPTRCNEFSEDPDSLLQLIRDNTDEVVAVGELRGGRH